VILTRRCQGTTLQLVILVILHKKKGLPVSLGTLFASIKERRRRSAEQSLEEGAQIMRRLQELLGVPTPTQKVGTSFTNARIENDPVCVQVRQS
jgi:hypothetical protein